MNASSATKILVSNITHALQDRVIHANKATMPLVCELNTDSWQPEKVSVTFDIQCDHIELARCLSDSDTISQVVHVPRVITVEQHKSWIHLTCTVGCSFDFGRFVDFQVYFSFVYVYDTEKCAWVLLITGAIARE
jgi:hypothetical protein